MTKPKRPRKLRPFNAFKAAALDAKARNSKRDYPPAVRIVPAGKDECEIVPAYSGEGMDAIIRDAFGTRLGVVADVFMRQLMKFCGTIWGEDGRIADELDLNLILTVIAANKPKNEAEACLAAQIAALHMVTMRVGARAHQYPYETPTVRAFARLAQASAVQHVAMARIKGKGTIRQKIVVKKSEHKHIHIHGGRRKNGGQPHATNEDDNGTAEQPYAVRAAIGAALQGDNEAGKVLRLPSRSGDGGVPDARGKPGNRRSEG